MIFSYKVTKYFLMNEIFMSYFSSFHLILFEINDLSLQKKHAS